MIKILGYKEVNKGAILGSVSIQIEKWSLTINRITVFQKDNRRWISMPSESFEKDGEKKYFPLVKFDEREVMDRFSRHVLESLDEYLLKLNAQEPRRHEEQEELPF